MLRHGEANMGQADQQRSHQDRQDKNEDNAAQN
jgi:hypothetical protein